MIAESSATVAGRFQWIVSQFGQRPAIRQDKTTITYDELDRRSAQIAECLLSEGAEASPLIGLSLSATSDMLAAMLSVMKIGSAYTIIDPGLSPRRKQAIAHEMALDVVLGDNESQPWPDFTGRWIDVNATARESTRRGSPRAITGSAACCVVQTSGTTGQPLGVEISHAALLHTIDNYSAMAAIKPDDRFTMLTSAAHFAAQTPIYGALLNGACLLPFDVAARGLGAMASWLEEESLTIYQSPPSLFRAFVRQLPNNKRFSAIRFLRLGGEPVLQSDVSLFRKHFPENAQFVNALGISEAGGNVAFFKTPDTVVGGPLLPIGSPSAGQNVILADSSGKEVPPGEVGEIVVRSDFLATGYYRRPDLTAQKFRTSGINGRRELWTGDLAHRTPEGWLMHDGRKDDQIKIRGHRVDIAGLESIVRSIPEIGDARVLPLRLPDNVEELFAFVIAATTGVSAASIRIKLANLIPGPVHPRVCVVQDLPLNAAGKIDRARLLQLALEGDTASTSHPPRDATERELNAIWCAVLGVSSVGVYDDFFASGGDSLAALSVISAVEARFELPFSPWLLVDRPTIAQMGEYITARRAPRALQRWVQPLIRQRAEQVVALRKAEQKSEAPLFICAGGWAHERELLVFASMLPHLPRNLPVYGLKQNFLSSSVPVSGSTDTIAKNFLAEIRKVQPRGPYRLLGECIAGVVALELASQLDLAGDRVETMILLEPRLPRSESPDTGLEPDEISEKVRRYYDVLTQAPPNRYRQPVHIIDTEGPEDVRRRLADWQALDNRQLEITRVPGDHTTYLRDHNAALAREIARIIFRPAAS